MKESYKSKCTRAMENYIGHIFQGIRDIKVTNTCLLIHRNKVPQDRKFACIRTVCNIRPQKKETHRLQLSVRGDKLTYDGPVYTPTADLTTSKLHWNIVLSTSDGKYLIVDVKDFYLNNPTKEREYLQNSNKIHSPRDNRQL